MSWQEYLEGNQERFREELLEFLRIPSVSALSEHRADVASAAEWVRDRLQRAGIDAEVLPTRGHPVVYGERRVSPELPTVLIYGHFDTQPVDPLELWSDPPFEPRIRDGKVYARGATDDKGNMLVPVLAAEALLRGEGRLSVNLKFFFEGEEEIGSPSLPEFLAAERERLACDFVLSADGVQWAEDQPALLLGFRGLCCLQIDVRGPGRDLHSGGFGGAVQNPNHALVEILASMRDREGRVQVPGFYDAVRPVSGKERERLLEIPFDEEAFRREVGVTELFGEPGFGAQERTWIRPTLEINGIWGGFQGEGTKTVIPREAHAKITCRLVADQAPRAILEGIERHVRGNTPPGVKVEVRNLGGHADPFRIPSGHAANRLAGEVLEEVYGKAPFLAHTGGSIPVCSLFHEELDAFTVCLAFGLLDENHHSPDEFFRLSSFERGQRVYCRMLQRVGDEPPQRFRTSKNGG